MEVETETATQPEKRTTRTSSREAQAQAQKYSQSDLYKPKPLKEGSTVETVWGTASVHRARMNGDVELSWPGNGDG